MYEQFTTPHVRKPRFIYESQKLIEINLNQLRQSPVMTPYFHHFYGVVQMSIIRQSPINVHYKTVIECSRLLF